MLGLVEQIVSAAKASKPRAKCGEQWKRATEIARIKHTANAVERYRGVMQGQGWQTGSKIECKLGYAATVSTCFLNKLKDELKLIERRNRYGSKVFIKKQGYEWRWIDGD